MYGITRDSSSGSGVPDAHVRARANCSGDGCAAHTIGSWVITTTESNGSYLYDDYGYSVDPSEKIFIYPRPGEESILLYILKFGLDLAYYGADPLHKDIFLEIDYYPGLKPSDTAIDMVVDAFADAPVSNPDGDTGINLHIIVDGKIATADVDNDLNPVWTDFDTIKSSYFESRRDWAFHYVLFANRYSGGSSSGISRGIPAHDFVVSLGNWSTPGGTVKQQAGTLMHELGHNLGLMHGGNENDNYKPNYISIMSYLYQLVGLTVDSNPGVVDYSRLRIRSVNEGSVRETTAFGPVLGSTTTEAELARYNVRISTTTGRVWLSSTASSNLDFDRDGVIEMLQLVYITASEQKEKQA